MNKELLFARWFLSLFCGLEVGHGGVASRVLDTVLAQGIDALFGFGLALLRANEARLLRLGWEAAVALIQSNMLDVYTTPSSACISLHSFMADVTFARQTLITPHALDSYALEFQQQLERASQPLQEVANQRRANSVLEQQIKQLERDVALGQTTCQELRQQVVRSQQARDEVGEQLVQYKTLYAEMALTQATQATQATRVWSSLAPQPPPTAGQPRFPGPSSVSGNSGPTTNFNGGGIKKEVLAGTGPNTMGAAVAQSAKQAVSSTVSSWGRWMRAGWSSESNPRSDTPSAPPPKRTPPPTPKLTTRHPIKPLVLNSSMTLPRQSNRSAAPTRPSPMPPNQLTLDKIPPLPHRSPTTPTTSAESITSPCDEATMNANVVSRSHHHRHGSRALESISLQSTTS